MRAYEEIFDVAPVADLTARERDAVDRQLAEPTDRYKQLVRALDSEGCKFPRVQAALMLVNTPGVVGQVLDQHFGQVLD